MFPFGRDLLAIYLQDHLAGSTPGVELARRAAAQNAGTPLARADRQLETLWSAHADVSPGALSGSP